MSNTPELAVIIPVYNEQDIIGKVLDDWSRELDRLGIDFRIHAYNDGSKDGTAGVLSRYSSMHGRVIAHDKPNTGHGPTILLGYCENSDSEWLFQIDSDDEMGPESFEELWRRRGEFDFLCGSRKGHDQPLTRKAVSSVSRLVVRSIYGRGVYDVNVPYRLMRSSVFSGWFGRVPSDTFAPNVILTGMACLKKIRMFEVPVKHKTRSTGEVSLKRMKLLKSAGKSFFQTVAFRSRLKGI